MFKASKFLALLTVLIMSITLCFFPSKGLRAEDDAEGSVLTFAQKAFNDGFYDLAQEKLESFLKSYPQTSRIYDAHILLGRCYFNQNKLVQAMYEFDQILNTPAAGKFTDEALYWEGEIYLKNGDFKKALEMYQRVMDEFPSSNYIGYAVYSKGWAYYRMRLFDEAMSNFKEVALKYPFEKLAMEAQFKIGECEYLLGSYDSAESELKKFIDKFPVSEKTQEAYYLEGEALFYQAKYKDAVTAFERAIAISSGAKWAPFAMYRVARCAFELGDYKKSEDGYKLCLEKADGDFLKSSCLMGMSNIYEKTGRLEEAKSICERIISEYPNSQSTPEAYYVLVRVLYAQAKYNEAEGCAKDAMVKFPKSDYLDDLHYELGWIYVMQSRITEAISEFVWIENESKDVNLSSSAVCKIGDIYFDQKDYKKAMESYDVVLDKYSDGFWTDYAQYQIGNIFALTDKPDQAMLAYQSALVNFPNTDLREKILFQLGSAYFKTGDFEHAAAEFEKFISEFPKSGKLDETALYRANSFYNLGKYSHALELFVKMAKDSKDENMRVMASYQVGWCYYNLNKDQEALKAFDEFLKTYGSNKLASEVKFWLGEYYSSKKIYDKAKECYVSLLGDPSSDIAEQALYQLGLLLYDEGKIGESIARLEELTSKYPGSDISNSAYMKIANIKIDSKDFDGAINYLRKALTTENNELNAQIQYEIAECLESKGQIAQATEEYLKVPYLYSKGTFWAVRSQLRCAQAFEKIEKLEEAKKLYEKLAAMDVEESEFAKKRLEWLRWRDTAKTN